MFFRRLNGLFLLVLKECIFVLFWEVHLTTLVVYRRKKMFLTPEAASSNAVVRSPGG